MVSVNRAGRDWALKTCPRATCTLALREPRTADERAAAAAQLEHTARALATRGSKPEAAAEWSTTLRLVSVDGSHPPILTLIQAVADAGAGLGVTDLQIHVSELSSGKWYGATDLLSRAAVAFPNITSLYIYGLTLTTFPKLPHLHHLTLINSDVTDRTSLRHIVRQLKVLHVTRAITYNAIDWHELFSGTDSSGGPLPLTHFSTRDSMDAGLVDLLLERAPDLAHVSVGHLRMDRSLALRAWGVQTLHVDAHVDMAELARLPWSRTVITVGAGKQVNVTAKHPEVS